MTLVSQFSGTLFSAIILLIRSIVRSRPKSPKANYIFDTTTDVPMTGAMRVHTEVVEPVTRRNLEVCCVQEVRGRGVSARLITRKNSEYKMYWVENNLGFCGVVILLAGK